MTRSVGRLSLAALLLTLVILLQVEGSHHVGVFSSDRENKHFDTATELGELDWKKNDHYNRELIFSAGENKIQVQERACCDDNEVVLAKEQKLQVHLEMKTGAATISLDDEHWFHLIGNQQQVVGWNNGKPLYLESTKVNKTGSSQGPYKHFGPFTNITFVWTASKYDDDNKNVLETSFLIFDLYEMVIFEQYFKTGWTNSKTRKADNDKKSTMSSNSPTEETKIVSGFPSINLTLPKTELGFIVWGGCFLSNIRSGDWDQEIQSRTFAEFSSLHDLFDGDVNGQPWLLYDSNGRAVVWSSLDNFFVSGFASKKSSSMLDIGLRTTLESIPSGYRHASVMVAGQGINATMMQWGDVLLKSGSTLKERSNVYDDHTLAHLGYWTDNGAYHYTGATGPNYNNMEEALLGMKKGMKDQEIPIRYVQWDDWWMETVGDVPGILSWTPKPEMFPSGFSDWLGMPLAMYAPEYAAQNVWVSDYTWKIDNNYTAIPLDPNFYADLFKNGTSIGMKMFEQDFLCTIGPKTSLTSHDVYSGKLWLSYMDKAAQDAGIKIQLCMPDAYHLLHSTLLVSVTNARGTGDNTRNYNSIHSMGHNSLLFYAMGIFASRDNVWTSNADVNQTGCGNKKFCYEPNAHLDNAVAVLSNGPYGIADAVGYVNKTVVMYSCRIDGLILRPRWPLAILDFALTDFDAKGSQIWAAHDDYGSLRWSYIVGVNLARDVAITPKRLLQGTGCSCGTMLAWEVVIGEGVKNLAAFSTSSPFMLPKSRPLKLPYEVESPPHTHYVAAPVLSNGMAFLGEAYKWAAMSHGRISSFFVDNEKLTIKVIGAPSEVITFLYLKDANNIDEIFEVICAFPSSCQKTDKHGNTYCSLSLTCDQEKGCICKELQDGGINVRGIELTIEEA